MSQSSTSSSRSKSSSLKDSSDHSDKEDDPRKFLEAIRDEAMKDQHASLKKLNKKMEKMFEERDRKIAEIRAKGEAMYQKMMTDHEDFCNENPGSVVDPIVEVIERLEKIRDKGLPELNRASEAIDPDNAEEVAKEITKKYAIGKRLRTIWRRRLVKKTHQTLVDKKAEIMESTDKEIKNFAAMVTTVMDANDSFVEDP